VKSPIPARQARAACAGLAWRATRCGRWRTWHRTWPRWPSWTRPARASRTTLSWRAWRCCPRWPACAWPARRSRAGRCAELWWWRVTVTLLSCPRTACCFRFECKNCARGDAPVQDAASLPLLREALTGAACAARATARASWHADLSCASWMALQSRPRSAARPRRRRQEPSRWRCQRRGRRPWHGHSGRRWVWRGSPQAPRSVRSYGRCW
jgi:hypothetical protein